ncbi:MAG TPA: FKBP-type peptidyl-prolyl cis-trans isomerase [Opitutaceae bacterium]
MKSTSIATLGLLLGLGATFMHAQTAPAAAPAPAAAFSDAQILEEVGWIIGKRSGLSELGFTKEETDLIIKGLRAAAEGKESPQDLDKIGPLMGEFMQKRQEVYVKKEQEKNNAKNVEFFAKLKDKKGVIALPSGLYYEITQEGTGASPSAADRVKVHYEGKLLDGTVFDSSIKRGQPAEFALNEVIPGWTEGLQKIKKGGKAILHVPYQLGYGEQGNQGIPPFATLVFEVELLDIVGGAPAPTPPPAPATK